MSTTRAAFLLSIALLILLVSCAPTAPDRRATRPGVTMPVSSVAVVTDAVIARDEMTGGDYCVLKGSRDASSWMLGSAIGILEGESYHVDYTLAPFVGGFLRGDEVTNLATEIGGPAAAQSPPFFASAAVSNDPEYRDALLAVLKRVASTNVGGAGPLVTFADSTVPDRPDWSLLSERMGTDYLLVAVAGGVSVSGEKQTGQFCLSSCLSVVWTAILNAICSSVTGGSADEEPPVEVHGEVNIETPSTMMSVAQMFDTRTGNVVWTSAMTYADIDPLSQSFYVREWAPSLLQGVAQARMRER